MYNIEKYNLRKDVCDVLDDLANEVASGAVDESTAWEYLEGRNAEMKKDKLWDYWCETLQDARDEIYGMSELN